MDTNTNIITTMTKHRSFLGKCILFLILLSCENTDTTEKNYEVHFSNIDTNLEYKSYFYIQSSELSFDFSSFELYGADDLADSILSQIKLDKSLSGIETNNLSENLSLNMCNGNVLLIYNDDITLVDYFLLKEEKMELSLKEINLYSISNTLKSNAINVLDETIILDENADIKNATFVFDDNIENIVLKNASIDASIFSGNSNLTNAQITFENVTINTSIMINMSNEIVLSGLNKFNNMYIANIPSVSFLFRLDNSDLTLQNTTIRNATNLFNCLGGSITIKNSYNDKITGTFIKSIDGTNVLVNNSLFTNLNTFSSSLNSDMLISNSIFSEFNILFTAEGQNITTTNSHFFSSSCEFLIDLHIPNTQNFRPIEKLQFTHCNFDITANSNFLIFIYQTIQTDIEFSDVYLNFNNSDETSLIRDTHPDFEFGDVIFFNRTDNLILNGIGINFL